MNNKDYPEYTNWKAMRARCTSPSIGKLRKYQSKNITVCEEWNDFKTFLKDMGSKPSPKHSIDRIDNDGNYEPSNCRWAIDLVQNRNKNKVITYTVKGFTGCIPEIAEHFNIKSNSIHKNMQNGMTIEEAVASLLKTNKITYSGFSLTKAEWADKIGIPKPTMYWRFKKFNSLDKVFEGYDIV
jgi:predicted DNA-binding protein YlxM (UPF0122 family)